nr:immunoglobulin light chain junction region [Macaca mulatta]
CQRHSKWPQLTF